MSGTSIIDVSYQCGGAAKSLATAGIKTIIRYYSRDTGLPAKRLSLAEARSFAAAGLRIAIVHEAKHGDKITAFDNSLGILDAKYVRSYGALIGQPAGTTVFFAVDFDATAAQIKASILPYFRGVADAMKAASGDPAYTIGVYGSGAVCKAVLEAGPAQLAWLAQSTGWTGYQAFLASGRWTLKQGPVSDVAGVNCDPDELAPGHALGDFALPGATPAAPAIASLKRAIARSGLRLRTAPQLGADIAGSLPFGAQVHALKTVDGWTMVDLQGDGAADGFVSAAFLEDATATVAATASLAPTNHDAACVAGLIHLGSTAQGLAAARKEGKAALSDYPHNGCAVHLSALLRAAGIDVPMTPGAGKLAYTLEKRGWKRVKVGSHVPGDVGVTFDSDHSIPGSDHVYLVVDTFGPDRMMIADNQNPADAPHERFASGHGKTPTDYFLRA